MSANWNLRLRTFYLYVTQGTSLSVEWAWLIGRLAVAIIAVPTTYATFDGFNGAGAVPIASGGAVAYSGLLAWLLRRGKVRLTFLIGFLLDNIVLVLAWWLTVRRYHPEGTDNDLWLIMLPITISGIARTGPMIGLAYVGLMSLLLTWITLGYQPPGSHGIDQLPVRLVFFGIVGALATWLVSELNLERESAKDLQAEAETLSEISQVIGTSMNPVDVFPEFSGLLRSLLPYDVLILAEINAESRTVEVLNVDGDPDAKSLAAELISLSKSTMMLEWLSRRGPQSLDESACVRLSGLADSSRVRLVGDAKSMVASAIVTGDRVTGTLIARSNTAEAFTSEHLRILSRVSELIGASMTNLQVYGQAIQLANEREARLTLDAANRKLQADNEARSFFLSAISHELRTPLTSIIAFNDLVLRNRNNNLTPCQLQHLELIRRNSKQLAALVEDLLDLSYVGSGKVRLTPQRFSPAEAIEQITSSVQPILQAKHQTLEWGPRSDSQTIIADRERFGQVAANILSNASKYSNDKSVISLEWSINDGTFEMSIRDEGSGISEQDMVHLFQPFFRAAQHRTDKIPGTGLGLVIVKSLLEAHDGGIAVEPIHKDGALAGTHVRVWLPADGSGLAENARQRKSA